LIVAKKRRNTVVFATVAASVCAAITFVRGCSTAPTTRKTELVDTPNIGVRLGNRQGEPLSEQFDAQRKMWNGEYRAGLGFNSKPNQLLVDAIRGRRPGSALDVGMGQGRNALYLAAQGWSVTGIDIADEGLRQARLSATRANLKLDAIRADADTWEYGQRKWDLVALLYFRPDDKTMQKVKASLAQGGCVVVEGFHKPVAQNWVEGELAATFGDQYRILVDQVVEAVPDWGDQPARLVRFIAERK
jgi:SAM-dependent methyltransferase